MGTCRHKNATSIILILIVCLSIIEINTLTPIVHAWLPTPPKQGSKLDVEADVGSIYFAGEIAEFYILVSLSGNPIDAEILANLYYNGTLYSNLTSLVESVSMGIYRIPYT